MINPVGRARELCSKYKAAHLPAEMAVVQFAFEFPDDGNFVVETVATALGVDTSAFDYVYKQLKEERKKQAELLEKAKTKEEKKLDDFAEGPSSTEEAYFNNREKPKSDGWKRFNKAADNTPPVTPPKPKTTFTHNIHKGTEWESAPAHLIHHCFVLRVAWPLDESKLKKTYREIAMANHPDRFPGDIIKEKTFKEAAEAYERLSTYLENLK